MEDTDEESTRNRDPGRRAGRGACDGAVDSGSDEAAAEAEEHHERENTKSEAGKPGSRQSEDHGYDWNPGPGGSQLRERSGHWRDGRGRARQPGQGKSFQPRRE